MNSKLIKNQNIRNAVFIGVLCSLSYLAVYFLRNILGVVTPQMIESGYTEEYIGKVSSVYFVFYGVGQLINGAIGDKIKVKYMISIGLLAAGVANFAFMYVSGLNPDIAIIVYGLVGFFLSMIYGPMTKVVAENTEPIYATRCSLGYTFASFFGSPVAGICAAVMVWQSVFLSGTVVLCIMAMVCFVFFTVFEKKGIIQYHKYDSKKQEGGSIRILLKHRIVKFTLISVLTGIVRTSVVFWLPTYTTQQLGFSAETSAMLFTVETLIVSFTAFVAVFVYEKLKRNMDLTVLIMFISAAVFFMLVYMVKLPSLNIAFLILAIMSSNGASSMIWSRYCPSLRDTGMVSSATGFLDFMSYMAAAVSNSIFANAVTEIGWSNLILIWCGLMFLGIIISLPYKRKAV